ncbi:type II secretion system protein GspM [Aquisalimonas asiatica]|uniref:Type II secretion system protein M n=1 Tax=Aquisalimonas asiatica TaxID=406100 RepID=A0A1H8VLE6_9GAMM|nr:type II secretion system protein M [Aquisalimonas asiatica]SEP16209.1 general secretion pathway protein M [Aquisalimonas asiatica]
MKQWWQGLAQRERRVLMLGGCALVVILYVFALRLPAERAVEDLEARVSQERALAGWMEQTGDRILALQGEEPASTDAVDRDQALFSLADESAREAGFGSQLARIEPAGDDGARVNFEGIAFDALIRWLVHLRQTYGVTADQVTIRRAAEEGRVDAQLLLEP